MPIPPPPPPPPPASAPPAVLQSWNSPSTQKPSQTPSCEGGRSALLADIQKGTRLKKVTQVNDRSAPSVNKSRLHSVDTNSTAGRGSGATPTAGPTLSGLFAGGFPVLRPVGQRDKDSHNHPVSRCGSAVSLKQPLWNLPPPGESFRGSAPDLSPSRRTLERTSSGSKTRPVSSYTAPPSPSQPTPPSLKPLSSPPTIAPPPPPPPLSALHQEHASNKPPPVSTCPPPPPPPSQIAKPTWLPVQSHSIPMPTGPPPPPPPSVPPSCLPDRSSGLFYPLSPSPKPGDVKFGNIRDSATPPPPPPPSSLFPASLSPPPPPPPPRALAVSPSRPAVPPLPPTYPCTAPSRKPPAIPASAGSGRLAPPPAPPARSPTTELSNRIPPPLPSVPPAPPVSLRNGHLLGFDDFESKFQFHPVEDFPPPEAFRPFPRTYPSKEKRVSSQAPGMRTHLR